MGLDSLKRRINDLEQKRSGPVEYAIRWTDDDEGGDPSKDGPDVIRLRWLDEIESEKHLKTP